MPAVIVPEREIAPPEQEEGLLQRVKTAPLVAEGTHVDSIIQLYEACYDGKPQASVFVFPSTIKLNSMSIEDLDANFSHVHLLNSRPFGDISPQEIYQRLLDTLRPLQSFMDHRYTFCRAQVDEHSFFHEWADYIKASIRDLRA